MTTLREQLTWMDRGMCVAAGMARWQAMSAGQQEKIRHGCPVKVPCARWMRQAVPLHRPIFYRPGE